MNNLVTRPVWDGVHGMYTTVTVVFMDTTVTVACMDTTVTVVINENWCHDSATAYVKFMSYFFKQWLLYCQMAKLKPKMQNSIFQPAFGECKPNCWLKYTTNVQNV